MQLLKPPETVRTHNRRAWYHVTSSWCWYEAFHQLCCLYARIHGSYFSRHSAPSMPTARTPPAPTLPQWPRYRRYLSRNERRARAVRPAAQARAERRRPPPIRGRKLTRAARRVECAARPIPVQQRQSASREGGDGQGSRATGTTRDAGIAHRASVVIALGRAFGAPGPRLQIAALLHLPLDERNSSPSSSTPTSRRRHPTSSRHRVPVEAAQRGHGAAHRLPLFLCHAVRDGRPAREGAPSERMQPQAPHDVGGVPQHVLKVDDRREVAGAARRRGLQGEMVELDKLLDVASTVLSPWLPPDAGLDTAGSNQVTQTRNRTSNRRITC